MADPFVAEIRIFPFNFAPKGWAFCDGQLLPLSQNTALFSLLGTTYGGNGESNFALPDLQGRAPMHPGQGPGLSLHDLGETGGSETVTLLESEVPAHSHALRATSEDGDRPSPSGRYLARGTNLYAAAGYAGPRRRRPAAQQHAALSDAQLLHRSAGRVPAANVGSGRRAIVLTLRAAMPEDEGFMFRVYASTRTEELAAVDWDDAQKDAFLMWQAATQHRYYVENYPGAAFQVILANGAPVGRLYLHRRDDEIRIMDIALLPEHRRKGYGTALLTQLLAEGQHTKQRVTIHVEMFNPALSLYRRLGFRQVAEHGVYWLMEWSPDVS